MRRKKWSKYVLAVDEEGGDRAPLANGHAYEVQPVPSTLGSADAAGKSASTIASYMTKMV